MTGGLRVGACLSLSGPFAQFGTQAARALRTWADWHGGVELVIEDDEGSPGVLDAALPRVAARSDVLLGPYSTRLARRAAQLAAQEDWLVWNHGGSGDDIETDYPGHVVSVLTPTGRYADPYVRRLAALGDAGDPALWIVSGPGSFGRHITAGARGLAVELGIPVRVVDADRFTALRPGGEWCLLSVGRFEDDIDTVRHAQTLSHPPRSVCAIAAGVREFADHVAEPDGIFGIAQWFPGNPARPRLGPGEAEFLRAYAGAVPDYPAIQAVAGAVIAEHCAAVADATDRAALWAAATALDTTTLFGGFRVDPVTGAQDEHRAVLLRWQGGQPRRCA